MDLSQILGATSMSGGSQVQGMGGHHHHHHKSISDQVSQMTSAIDNAVTAGTMTSDQATTLKNELADITKMLSQASTTAASATSGTSTTGQSNQLSQLSDADRKKIFSELKDVRQQLFGALNPQAANATSGTSGANNAVSQLFSQIDTDGNGSISQSEFTQFLAQIGANALGYNQNGSASSVSMQFSESTFSAIG
jgi:EF-hand domain